MKFCSQCGRLMAEKQSSASSSDGGSDNLTAGLAGASGVALSRGDSFGSSSEKAMETQSDLTPQIAPPPPPRYDSRPPQYAPPPPAYSQEFEGGAYSPPRYNQLPVPVGYAQPVIGFQCPNCRTNIQPLARERVSQTGWIVLAVLIIVCAPLFWIGLLMKEPYRVCSQCGHTLS
jgi:hypothetical protein